MSITSEFTCSPRASARTLIQLRRPHLLRDWVSPVLHERVRLLCLTDDSRHTRARRGRVPMGLVSMTMNLKVLEWFGVITAIAYSLFVASNIGLEFLGFVLLFISALSIGAWAYLGGHRGILLLQFFYAVAGLIGMVRWF